jgi:hypothetical protein
LISIFLEIFYLGIVTIDTFKREIAAAAKAYDKYVVCVDKTPSDFEVSLQSLMVKAIKAYENRGAGMRHGIALDKRVTIILSESGEPCPMCGIYFNLHSPYQKDALPKTVKPLTEKSQKPEEKGEG